MQSFLFAIPPFSPCKPGGVHIYACLKPIVERLGGEDALRRKMTVVEGDLDEPLCGIASDRIDGLQGTVDIVVNLVGLVEFDPPLDESVKPNVYGTQHVIDLVRLLDAKLVHISTCYVAGKKEGVVPEDTPIDGYFSAS